MSDDYRVTFTDLLTETAYFETVLSGLSFSETLNDVGTFDGNLLVWDPSLKGVDPFDVTTPGRTAAWIDRDGVLIWGGIIWKRRYAGGTTSISLQGESFESIGKRRLIRTNEYFAAVDQFQILRTLWQHMQAVPGGNIGITFPTYVPSGVVRDRTYMAIDMKQVLEASQQLGAVINGFDWRIRVYYDVDGSRKKEMVTSYPKLGVPVVGTPLLWEYPGNMLSYDVSEDSDSAATRYYAIGAGEPPDTLIAQWDQTSDLASGWPLLEGDSSYKDVSIPATLQGHATEDGNTHRPPVTVITVTVRSDEDPYITDYTPGDYGRFRITDRRYPNTWEFTARVVKREIRTSSGGKPDGIALTITDVVTVQSGGAV